ncbi:MULTISPECIES: hypothetical protein [unclassified Arthrobacter]|uniref:hypothetical protein n=1 Tax=unclassified Arthrobacter TaxID=235627 RepID=UPI00177C772A|nr:MULTISPECIES: hypothetical protein [unclassified Arthrobacter]
MNTQCPLWLTESETPWTTAELADRLISGRQVARLVRSGDLVRLQVQVRTRHGDHRLDFAWRQLLLALEFDGRIKYFAYAPTNQVLFEERRREKALMEDGWQFIRIEWGDLFREAELRRRIASALQRASQLHRKSA